LALIFRSSLATGIVPEDWRIANVVPLFKKGSRDNPGNYRPVSLTSVVGKVLERIIKDTIYNHLDRNNMIRDSQHGFVKGRSCLTNLIEFFEKVTEQVDKGRAVDVVYMDFSKAFDKVPHGRLLQKIRRLGIEGDLEMWIRNWLVERRQRVVQLLQAGRTLTMDLFRRLTQSPDQSYNYALRRKRFLKYMIASGLGHKAWLSFKPGFFFKLLQRSYTPQPRLFTLTAPTFHLFTVCGAVTLASPNTITEVTVGEQVLFHVNIQGEASYDVTFRSKAPNAILAAWMINNNVSSVNMHSLYEGRLQWNMNGSVVLLNIQINDSGPYEIEIHYYSQELKNSDIEGFELLVFEPVSQPDVKIFGDCTTPNITLSCLVSNGTSVTFHWRKESLSGTTDGTFNGTQLAINHGNEEEQHVYWCIAENPVSNAKSNPVRLELCNGNNGGLYWTILLSLLIPVSLCVCYAIISIKAGRAIQEHSEQPITLPNGFIEPTYTTTLLIPRGTV
ncbi:uncharacterized protein LOC119975618, partial [Scyliorhinus canicula]|uniref:uncharacterized protein LOC119975618 n=1 Tax=Scyliorhinus canicula TaxID=7830 RepID=UPI0018F71441